MSVKFGALACITGCGRASSRWNAVCLQCDGKARERLVSWARGMTEPPAETPPADLAMPIGRTWESP